ncbi:PREDICTED: uncharacterized protein LOC109217452 [Nicotiana attenuata]|uniref:uncharacterized protein LOC109217452 n=1 Tax=Nicotiana attenuata TaxID=49451 RepID=UPI0009051C7A|nr:PREDICTED: uncharacterized protein LOC109217452 [Nicotiana attenuata]
MKKLWEELNTLNTHAQCKCQCTCGAKASRHKAEQDRRLIQFLMGLNEVYTAVRGSILMMNPLPSLAQAFAILIQEEKQREMKPNNQLMIDSSALSVNRAANNNFRTSYSQQGNGSGGSSYTNYNQSSGTEGNSFRGNYPTNRPRPVCDYCKKPGHTNDRCYKLHGYPQDSKFNKGKRVAANVFGDYGDKVAGIGDGERPQTKEEGRTGSAEDSSEMKAGAVNFAGISACSTSLDSSVHSYECFKPNADSWILDSGATNHMTYNKSILSNIKTLVCPFLVTLPDGYKVKAPSLKRTLEIGKASDGLYYQISELCKNVAIPTQIPTQVSSIYLIRIISFEEAVVSPAWQSAMNQEFEALIANNTWSHVPLPVGKSAVGCK